MTELRPENNGDLQDDLMKYDNVRQNLKRLEILDYVKRDYPQYPWGLPTLDRRLRCFGIRYISYDTPIEEVEDAVQKEIDGPGRLLDYKGQIITRRLGQKSITNSPAIEFFFFNLQRRKINPQRVLNIELFQFQISFRPPICSQICGKGLSFVQKLKITHEQKQHFSGKGVHATIYSEGKCPILITT